MSLKIKKDELVDLSDDINPLDDEMTPHVGGGATWITVTTVTTTVQSADWLCGPDEPAPEPDEPCTCDCCTCGC